MLQKTKLRFFSFFMAIIMMVTMLPVALFATENEQVYISVSYDSQYINDKNGTPIAYVPVSLAEIASVDLEQYGLSDYRYDADSDGSYETTALQLIIYAHENLYGGDWSEVTFTGSPGSSYFQGGIFGFDENLNYYLNGEYPLAGEGWGATSDQIVISAGDFLDIGSFSSWDFYMDSNYGFHFFADENESFTHNYTVEAGEPLSLKLVRSFSGMGSDATVYTEADYTVYYGTSYREEAGTVVTDDSGCAEITFPSAGTWYLWADGGYGSEYPTSIVSTPAYAIVTVTEAEAITPEPEIPRKAQDVSDVLNATMAKLAATVTEPVFGTTAGEWTVFSLARGGYYAKDNAYFNDYYNRIVETVNTTAAKVNLNGALHKSKSTDNSRLIVALSSIGKDATSVGDWNLITPYDDFSWIKKQGLNGTIWTLIALDSNNYTTYDTTIRQQCVDSILSLQHDDGGWALTANKTYASDPDMTGMALQALYPYRDQEAVALACAKAFDCLSQMQHENGTFASGGSECSESCAWVIVACCTWGINPDTDSRFIKNDNSVVDALLGHYMEEESMFQHIIGAGSNAMATDQSCYALVAYNRLYNNQTGLYDYRDVTFDSIGSGDSGEAPAGDELKISLGIPEKVEGKPGTLFHAVLSVNTWDNKAGYKMMDFIMNVPAGLDVTAVTAAGELSGGAVSYHLEPDTNKLRVVYFDANTNNDLTLRSESFPTELFTISFRVNEAFAEQSTIIKQFNISMEGMSVKTSSDSSGEQAMIIVNTEDAYGSVAVVAGVTYSAVCLYEGDNIDLIPSNKKAVAVAVTGIKDSPALTYFDGTNRVEFKYSAEITAKTGVVSYIALVDASIAMENFVNKEYFSLGNTDAGTLTFGDSNADGVINAQDALAAVDCWLRKTEITSDDQILALNVNGDSRLNTFDALGIVESFVNNSDFAVVSKASTLATKQ